MTHSALLLVASLTLLNTSALIPASSYDANSAFIHAPKQDLIDSKTSLINETSKAKQTIYILDLSNQNLTNEQLKAKLDQVNPETLCVLNISNNKLSGTIDLNAFSNLNFLDCSHNQIHNIDCMDTALVRIDCSYNNITSMDAPESIYMPDDFIADNASPDLGYDPTKIKIKNDFSHQTKHISVAKEAKNIDFNDNFPGFIPSKMHDLKGAHFLDEADDGLYVDGDQFSFQYEVAPNMDKSQPNYYLDVTVYLDRQDSSKPINPPIDIPGAMEDGTIGKQDPTTKPQSIYRLYNPNSGEHFYTTSAQEKSHLVKVGWRDEGIGWTAPEISSVPVYRLYNPNAGDHHYTTNTEERNVLQTLGWKYEQISFYSDEFKSIPLYRQYNPNAKSGAHNYTTDKQENDHLVAVGWKAEDIAWYALSK